MSGDYHPEDEQNENDMPAFDNTPASVIFMEMMRQAAANNQPEPPVQQVMVDEDLSAAATPSHLDEIEDEDQRRRLAAMEVQRVRRTQRRRERRRQNTVGMFASIFRTLVVVVISGGLIATILSWWTTPQSLDPELRSSLGQAVLTPSPTAPPTILPTPNWLRRVGIVSGHRGPENDPGAVCPDGLTENEINFAVAQRVVLLLRERGYSVDLLEEFDPRLTDYRADALVSIHANDCRDYGEYVSGFLVAQAEARPVGWPDTQLVECIATHYGSNSTLERRFGLTRDMTDYHIFREINLNTPGAILELGFMLADRDILVNQPDLLAQGITEGIICFLEGQSQQIITTPQPGTTGG